MRPIFFGLLLLNLFLSGVSAVAQTCTGSLGAPVINETFGAGSTYGLGGALSSDITNLKFAPEDCGGNDGTYTITTFLGSSCKGGTWQTISHDHTGNPNGYMMIINADYSPSLFYTSKTSGSSLCPNTTYQFAAWIMNILRDLPRTQNFIKPNITFSIETAAGTVLKTYNTGDIDATDQPIWKQYGTFFTTPPDGPDIVVKMTNNAIGGAGNDLALDDITFSPCGPLVQTGFGTLTDRTDRSSCANDNLNYTLVSAQTGYTDPSYQWQQNKNDGSGWTNIANEKQSSLQVIISNAVAGKYQYRVGVLSSAQAGSESCRIYADPLTVNVYPPPTITLAANTTTCVGQPLQLSVAGGETYQWTGPNNFTSTDQSPIVTKNADPSYNGDYTVIATKNSCSASAKTTVNIYPKATIDSLSNVTICNGAVVQLSVKTTNAKHFKWHPSAGLNYDNIANPLASPSTTTTYTVEVSNDGCPDVAPSASITVNVNQNPVADAGKPFKIFEGQTAKLNGKAQGDHIITYWTPTSFLDDPKSLTPTTTSPNDITYTLHVASTAGCGQSTSEVFVRVYKKLTIPNTFTPNNDGINDEWNIRNLNTYGNANVQIYTRYGQLIYQSTGYGKPWNGTYNSALLPVGTYYYVIDLKDSLFPKLSGWVLLVR